MTETRKFLSSYIFRLTALSPVFVGSGSSIGKKEYILPPNGSRIVITNLPRMYKYLRDLGKARAFEDFLLKGSNELYYFLKEAGVKQVDYDKFREYEISTGDVDRVYEINTFVKDPYGNPFIPGSGLKGALRTAFTGCALMRSPEKYAGLREDIKREEYRRRNNYMNRPSGKLDEMIFAKLPYDSKTTATTRDIMRGLRIGDSMPLSAKDLVVCRKIDVSPGGGEKSINTLRECLKPGAVIDFPVTVDDDMFPYSPEETLAVVRKFYEDYAASFLSKFREGKNYGGSVLYIGGGAGYATKTVTWQLFKEDRARGLSVVADIMKNTTRREHHHDKDVALGVSPHMKKCTGYGGATHEFGACKFSILERKSAQA
jgi:CRISPR-associated protein Csm5